VSRGLRCARIEVPITSHPWQSRYDPGVRPTLAPYPDRTILDYVDDAVRERPDHPALIFKGRRISCAELDRLSNAFAAALTDLGVKKGDRIALLLPNSPQFVIAEMGAWKIGAVVVALNPIYTEHELTGPLAQSGAEVAVVLTPFLGHVRACRPHTRLRHIVASSIKDYLPPVSRVLFTLFMEKKGGHAATLEANESWFEDQIRRHAGAPRPSAAVGSMDAATLLMSGGTTGTPKGVVALHRAYVIAGLQVREWIKGLHRDWEDSVLLPLPMFHVYANVGVQGLAFVTHSPLALIPNPREIDDVLKSIEKVKPAFFTGVPTLFIALLNHPRTKAGKVNFTSIKVSFSGAAPLMADTKKRFEEITGGRIIEGYSLTEGLMACVVNPLQGPNKIGSVGLPLPDVEVVILNPDENDRECASGEVGEILLRSPQVMTSYWNNPEETALVLRTHGEGGPWVHTGDLGYLDEEGYLFIVDRQKDLIKTSGFQVWPREIEESVATHPAVAEVGVAGVPDAVKGQVVWAWVVLRANRAVTEDELRAHCRASLAPYKVPAHIEFRRDLPKTMVGKVLRRQLAAEAKASVSAAS
jgi:long-chain acyl-CoA synthetase